METILGWSVSKKQGGTTCVMVAPQLRLSVLVLACPSAYGQSPNTSDSQAISQPLEIHLANPPHWKKSCLEVSIRRTNHSKSPIFLPSGALLVYSSVNDASNTLGQGNGLAWLPVYGISDFIDSSVSVSSRARQGGTPTAFEILFPLLIRRRISGETFASKETSASMAVTSEKHLIGR
jgi:hypothetical protein